MAVTHPGPSPDPDKQISTIRQTFDEGPDFLRLEDAVEIAPTLRGLGIDVVAREQNLAGAPASHEPGQSLRSAATRQDAQRHLHLLHRRAAAHAKAHVECLDQLAATSPHAPFDLGDGDLLHAPVALARDTVNASGRTEDGLGVQNSTEYTIRFSDDANGANGFKLSAVQPEQVIISNSEYLNDKTYGHRDSNGTIGGPGGITTTDEEGVISGFDGFEDPLINSDGKLAPRANGDGPHKDEIVLYTRANDMGSGGDVRFVEIAFDYLTYNEQFPDKAIFPGDIGYLIFEANDGYLDNSNYLWNDKNTAGETGSPYFGIDLGNVDQLDTLTGTGISRIVPEPRTAALVGLGVVGLATLRRRWGRTRAVQSRAATAQPPRSW